MMSKENQNSVFTFLPSLLVLLFAIIFYSFNFSFFRMSILPYFLMAMTFFWLVFLPKSMPKILLFLLGILHDTFLNNVLGTSSLLLLLFYWLVSSQREEIIKQQFFVTWMFFLSAIILITIPAILLHILYFGLLLDVKTLFFETITIFALYPLVYFCLYFFVLICGGKKCIEF